MLERKIVQTPANGQGYLICDPNTGKKTGTWVYLNGSVTGAEAGTTIRPGYATSGSIKWSPASSGTSYHALVGIMDKLHYRNDESDMTLDTITSGLGINVYTDGYFETDQYTDDVWTGASVGQRLYLDANGVLCTGLALNHNNPACAIYWGKLGNSNYPFAGGSTYDSNYTPTGMIYIQVLPRARQVVTTGDIRG